MLDLREIKVQCRIDDDWSEDDALLNHYAAAAIETCSDEMERVIYEDQLALDAAADTTGIVLNARIKQAAFLLIAHWYASREAVVIGTISSTLPLGFKTLLWRLRIYSI